MRKCLLHTSLQDARHDGELLRAQREEAEVARQEAEATLRNARKEIEAQELVRDLKSLDVCLCLLTGIHSLLSYCMLTPF